MEYLIETEILRQFRLTLDDSDELAKFVDAEIAQREKDNDGRDAA